MSYVPHNTTIHYHLFSTDLGLMLSGESSAGICFLEFGSDSTSLIEKLRKQNPGTHYVPLSNEHNSRIAQLEQGIERAIGGEFDLDTLLIAPIGTGFQQKVWKHLRSIPSGEVRSYSEVAQALGSPGSTRAVAKACASNSIALLIPCHRVVRSDGSLGGFRWGLEKKHLLLLAERRARITSHATLRSSEETTKATR